MSDSHHNDGHGGHAAGFGAGHEVDQPPTRELFNIVWGLGAATLLSLVTCVQLFTNQRDEIMEERGKEVSFVLAKYRKDNETLATGSGTIEVKDAGGKVIARQKYRPIAAARAELLADPKRLAAAPAPAGWVHPDDIAAGTQGGTVPPAASGGAVPTDGGLGAAGTPNPAGVDPAAPTGAAAALPTTPGVPTLGAPSGAAPNHPLGEPAVLPAGTGPADPTVAAPIPSGASTPAPAPAGTH
jgi:hypothetical protein